VQTRAAALAASSRAGSADERPDSTPYTLDREAKPWELRRVAEIDGVEILERVTPERLRAIAVALVRERPEIEIEAATLARACSVG